MVPALVLLTSYMAGQMHIVANMHIRIALLSERLVVALFLCALIIKTNTVVIIIVVVRVTQVNISRGCNKHQCSSFY